MGTWQLLPAFFALSETKGLLQLNRTYYSMGIVAIIKMNKVAIIEMGAGKKKHRNQTSEA